MLKFRGETGRIGVDDAEIRNRVVNFLAGRAESMFWQRDFAKSRDLCELARDLDVYNERFAAIEKKHPKAPVPVLMSMAGALMGIGMRTKTLNRAAFSCCVTRDDLNRAGDGLDKQRAVSRCQSANQRAGLLVEYREGSPGAIGIIDQ